MQKFGLAMVRPPSPTLSNLHMEFFKKYKLPKSSHLTFLGSGMWMMSFVFGRLEPFIEKFNGLVPFIKFTVEEEQNSSIYFLDIKIHRHNNLFEFCVYRKPTIIYLTCIIIPIMLLMLKYQCSYPCSFEH